MTATAIVGAAWGSEGKGVVAAALAPYFGVAVRVGGPNAGHSFKHDGETVVMRGLPCAWTNPDCDLVIGAGAVVDPELLISELVAWDRSAMVDPQAILVTEEDIQAERTAGLGYNIGSTLEGVGAARSRKLGRSGAVLAGAYGWPAGTVEIVDTAAFVHQSLRAGVAVMLEGTQGSGLSLHHGRYPYVTSDDTNVSGIAAAAGVAAAHIEHTFLVARTLPIRVGGNSGPMGEELSWDVPRVVAGVQAPEQTTVTKKLRRISRWDDAVFSKAVALNEPCGVFLMFADYLVPEMVGTTDADLLLERAEWAPNVLGDLRQLTDYIEHDHHVPIVAYGTGGPDWALAHRGACAHGVRWG